MKKGVKKVTSKAKTKPQAKVVRKSPRAKVSSTKTATKVVRNKSVQGRSTSASNFTINTRRAATILGKSAKEVRELVKSGKLKTVKKGTAYYYNEAAVRSLLPSTQTPPKSVAQKTPGVCAPVKVPVKAEMSEDTKRVVESEEPSIFQIFGALGAVVALVVTIGYVLF